jgi:DNA-directed RNA polymerase
MTRSAEGRFVNITPQAEGGDRVVLHTLEGDAVDAVVERSAGADFYGMMALALWKRLRICPRLQQLMKDPADRKIVKRPIVSFFYGGTLSGMQNGVRKLIDERNEKKREKGEETTPIRAHRFSLYQVRGITYGKFGSVRFKTYNVGGIKYGRFVGRYLRYMFVKILDRIVAENAPVAVGVRTFLRALARVCAKHNKPLCFTTPLGFPVIGAYYKPVIHRFAVPTRSGRRYVNLIVGHKDEIDRRDAVDGIAANFVHAADGCHLHMVALAVEKEAIDEATPMPMASVHDCYAFLACHAARGNEIIRDQYIRLHRHNLLNEVRESARCDLPETANLPDLLQRDDLELEQIAKSFFAFN